MVEAVLNRRSRMPRVQWIAGGACAGALLGLGWAAVQGGSAGWMLNGLYLGVLGGSALDYATRVRWQFSLRLLLVLTAACAVGLGDHNRQRRRRRRGPRRHVLAALVFAAGWFDGP
jgi:hypothetical protein